MKSLKKRLLSVLLVVTMLAVMVLPELPALDVLASSLGGGNSAMGNASWGWNGDGWMIGLGRCENEVYNGSPGDVQSLYDWIATYRSKYYEHVQGGAYYLSNQGGGSPGHAGQATIIGNGGDPLGILNSVKSGSPGEYLEVTENGYAVKKEKIAEVMESLKECNPSLYQQYCNNPFGIDGHPVVIVVEAVMSMTNGDGYTVEDCATMYGTSVYGYDISNYERITV
ncbi:MAG: hypothetical protein NC489_31860, partial [Ruminococcus flavefaciens]|nr:hypothetical protein [Ruminococcus flavefaciens]